MAKGSPVRESMGLMPTLFEMPLLGDATLALARLGPVKAGAPGCEMYDLALKV